MKVFAYVGSMKQNSYTLGIVRRLAVKLRELEKVDADIVFAGNQDIRFCQGCGACMCGGSCRQRDDFDKIYSKIKEADVIVLASPVYLQQVSGCTKNFIDRGCFGIYTLDWKGKVGITISTSASNGNKYVNSYMHKVLNMHGAYVAADMAFQVYSDKVEETLNACCERVKVVMEKDFIRSDAFLEHRYVECKKLFMKFGDDNWIRTYWEENDMFSKCSFDQLIQNMN